MDLGIEGRVAIVFGAGGGIGGGIAAALAREGAQVAACDINPDALAVTVEKGKDAGLSITPVVVNLGDHASELEGVNDVRTQLGPISILVNNTGGPPPTGVSGVPLDTWRAHFESMVASVFNLTEQVLPDMREQGWGRIITSTSSGVITPIPLLGISNTLRLALVGWSKTLAGEVGRDGITVNVVVPGRIATARAIAIDVARAEKEGRTSEEVAAASAASIPVGRYGTPAEYADVVSFLASSRASFVSGSVVRVDGGMVTCI